MKDLNTDQIILLLLAIIISAYLLVALVGVTACVWHSSECKNLDLRFYLGEPLAATLGLLARRATGGDKQ